MAVQQVQSMVEACQLGLPWAQQAQQLQQKLQALQAAVASADAGAGRSVIAVPHHALCMPLAVLMQVFSSMLTHTVCQLFVTNESNFSS